jgi:hypothetical protein
MNTLDNIVKTDSMDKNRDTNLHNLLFVGQLHNSSSLCPHAAVDHKQQTKPFKGSGVPAPFSSRPDEQEASLT